jgi:hypothetical protein
MAREQNLGDVQHDFSKRRARRKTPARRVPQKKPGMKRPAKSAARCADDRAFSGNAGRNLGWA